MILTLWARETKKEKSKNNNINLIFKRIGFCFGNLWPQAYTPNHTGSSRTMIEEKWSSWDLNSQPPASQGNPQLHI